MYKVELTSTDCLVSEYDNTQLICSYIFIKKTFKYLYKRQLQILSKNEQKAIIYDLSLFETLKEKKYLLRTLTPQKWLENWCFYNILISELKKRELYKANS
ncbi:MAG: hypothetical protein CR986_00555 [Ignavibacteriae bacterium]|nr:MAG: hypothetical protein CR986_00555 [Ignavibacteriota bacterium]